MQNNTKEEFPFDTHAYAIARQLPTLYCSEIGWADQRLITVLERSPQTYTDFAPLASGFVSNSMDLFSSQDTKFDFRL